MARERHIWIVHRQPFMAHMLERIGFLDETWLKTNMTKTTGWALRKGAYRMRLLTQLPMMFDTLRIGNAKYANQGGVLYNETRAGLRWDR